MAAASRISALTVIRNLETLTLGENAAIGHWNWISAAKPFHKDPGASFALELGSHTAITSRHYLDCPGGIYVGAFATISGVRSTFLTHQIDTTRALQSVAPIRIGDYCLISSNVCVTPGTSIAARCVIAMGAVVVGDLAESDCLYAGVPARIIRHGIEGAYFSRSHGAVPISPPSISESEPTGTPRNL